MRALLIATFLSTFSMMAPAMSQTHHFLTNNILERVRKIAIGPTTGTAFSLELDKRQYLVTAKHVVATLGNEGIIKVFVAKDATKDFKVKILRCADPVDIAVLVPEEQITPAPPLEVSEKGMIFSQDVFFVGFPFGDDTLITHADGFSVGFIRKAVFSAQERGDGSWVRYYLDGTNNKGFSGGPVVFHNYNEEGHPLRLTAVISAFRPDVTEVERIEKIDKAQVTPEDNALGRIVTFGDGTVGRLVGTGTVTRNNAGIVIAYGIGPAIALIESSGSQGPLVK